MSGGRNPFYNSSTGTSEINNLDVVNLTVTGTATGPFGTGTVIGPVSSIINNALTWDSIDGTTVKDSLIPLRKDVNTSMLIGGPNGISTNGSEGNLIIGFNSSKNTFAGDNNIIIGNSSNTSVSSGAQNVIVGNAAGQSLTNGSGNTLFGYNTGTAFGTTGSQNLTGASTYNTLFGDYTGVNTTGLCYGRTALGTFAVSKHNSSVQLGSSVTVGPVSDTLTCFLGSSLLMYRNNVTFNTIIGTEPNIPTIATAFTNSLCIGEDYATASNQMWMGNTSHTSLQFRATTCNIGLLTNRTGTNYCTTLNASSDLISTTGTLRLQHFNETGGASTVIAGSSCVGQVTANTIDTSFIIQTTAYKTASTSHIIVQAIDNGAGTPTASTFVYVNYASGSTIDNTQFVVTCSGSNVSFIWYIVNSSN